MAQQQKQSEPIKIPDFQLEFRDFVNSFNEKVKTLQSSFNTFTTLTTGVLVLGFLILVFALATMLIQSWQLTSTFQTESNQLKIQGDVINNDVTVQKSMLDSQAKIEKNLQDIKNLLQK